MPASDSLLGHASEEKVSQLEQAINRRLPPSYKAFLLLQNGFPEIDGATSLLSTDEIISLIADKAEKLLNKITNVTDDDSIRNYIVFGTTDNSTSAFLFDPEQQNDDGELKVIEFDEEEGSEATHSGFLEFLIQCTSEIQEAEKETLVGQDLLDMDF